jgi:hypothetical protein
MRGDHLQSKGIAGPRRPPTAKALGPTIPPAVLMRAEQTGS